MRTACLFAMLALMAVGCGGASPPTFPVTGKVLFADGSPVTHGIIEFAPRDGGEAARSTIAADGSFDLKTGTRRGAAPGAYRIAVIQVASAEDVAPRQHQAHAKQLRVPAQYRSPETSGLERTIEAGATKDLVIPLSAGPAK
jgi:hypothetical protein